MPTPSEQPLQFPRHRFARGLLRAIARIILPIFFRIEINGWENFPKEGPLILAGNHNAAMEGVLMAIYTPFQVEFLGTGDIPQEKITEFFQAIYKYIPIRRGHVDRPALQKTLSALKAGGVLGIFPEGGIWDPGQMRAQSGVAWLSYRAKAPVLPIGYAGTLRALESALKFKRPKLNIFIGKLIPAAEIPKDVARKTYFETYSEDVLHNIRQLLPEDDPARDIKIQNERFSLAVSVQKPDGQDVNIPNHLVISQGQSLTKFMHRPVVLFIFRFNLQLNICAIEKLHESPTAAEIRKACDHILNALHNTHPYLLTYRFGPKEGETMRHGVEELQKLAHRAEENNVSLRVT
nr:1-acyl-sn-glycerol-3-phosphate acyltransferase [Chloroflexota bacterium]